MRVLRSTLSLACALAAGACSPPDDACFVPRTGNETSCDVFDTGGIQWTINAEQPLENMDALCAASCFDAPANSLLAIANYRDLRKVPLLAKFRRIETLLIDVEGLPDLRGLESVAIADLTLSTHGKDMTTFHSLDGLGSELDSLSLDLLMGLTDFDGSRFTHLRSFNAEDSALERVSLASLQPTFVSLSSLPNLTSVELGGGTLTEINLHSLTNLPSFTWQPGLKIRGYNIQNNSTLSSCLVQDFINETFVPPARGTTLVANNGPCP